jgi:hypothetical protein
MSDLGVIFKLKHEKECAFSGLLQLEKYQHVFCCRGNECGVPDDLGGNLINGQKLFLRICKLTKGLGESLLFKVEDPDILGVLVIDKVIEVIEKITWLAPATSLDDASCLTILEKDAEGFLGVVSVKQDFIDLGQTPTRTLNDSVLPDQWGI